MLAVGILYLLYEKSIVSQSKETENPLASSSIDSISRMILGGQVRIAVSKI
jgi:GPI ethanolamine phosphate transferase 1